MTVRTDALLRVSQQIQGGATRVSVSDAAHVQGQLIAIGRTPGRGEVDCLFAMTGITHYTKYRVSPGGEVTEVREQDKQEVA